MGGAEAAARDQGCRAAYLDTFTFQAPKFYRAARLQGIRPARRVPARPFAHLVFKAASLTRCARQTKGQGRNLALTLSREARGRGRPNSLPKRARNRVEPARIIASGANGRGTPHTPHSPRPSGPGPPLLAMTVPSDRSSLPGRAPRPPSTSAMNAATSRPIVSGCSPCGKSAAGASPEPASRSAISEIEGGEPGRGVGDHGPGAFNSVAKTIRLKRSSGSALRSTSVRRISPPRTRAGTRPVPLARMSWRSRPRPGLRRCRRRRGRAIARRSPRAASASSRCAARPRC